MLYKIGDIAKLLGTTTDTLRHYEKRGLVKPIKNKDNEYRYYDFWDVNFIIDSLWFRAFEFSIDQVANLLKAPTVQDLSNLFEKKENEYRKKIQHYELLLERSEQHRNEVSRIQTFIGKCDVQWRPEYFRYINRYSEDFEIAPPLLRSTQKWLEVMPFVHRYFEIPHKALLQREIQDYQWGFELSKYYVEKLGLKLEPPNVHVPEAKCIHSVFKSSEKGNFSPRHLDYMVSYAHENGMTITGPASGILLASLLENGQYTGYFEAWIPVG